MSDIAVGTSAMAGADVGLMKQAGIGWVRQGFSFPFVDRMGGTISEAYAKSCAQAKAWKAAGMNVMGVSPLPGGAKYEADESGALRLKWRPRLPEWCGPIASRRYYDSYRAACEHLAGEMKGVVSIWQIANELDIEIFAGPLDVRQASEFILAGAGGLKRGDPSALVGHNPAGDPKAYFLFGRLYGGADALDYCGVDGYFGTWQAGEPGMWADRIAELHRLTATPVLVNEWGFASAGGVMAEDSELPPGQPHCRIRKWRHTWGPGHTPAGQAAFVRGAFEAFASQRDALLGAFFYRWEDQAACWQCGSPDCPMETAWGLVDLAGRPKPSWQAFQEGAALLK